MPALFGSPVQLLSNHLYNIEVLIRGLTELIRGSRETYTIGACWCMKVSCSVQDQWSGDTEKEQGSVTLPRWEWLLGNIIVSTLMFLSCNIQIWPLWILLKMQLPQICPTNVILTCGIYFWHMNPVCTRTYLYIIVFLV